MAKASVVAQLCASGTWTEPVPPASVTAHPASSGHGVGVWYPASGCSQASKAPDRLTLSLLSANQKTIYRPQHSSEHPFLTPAPSPSADSLTWWLTEKTEVIRCFLSLPISTYSLHRPSGAWRPRPSPSPRPPPCGLGAPFISSRSPSQSLVNPWCPLSSACEEAPFHHPPGLPATAS